jgi:hypothetical protein
MRQLRGGKPVAKHVKVVGHFTVRRWADVGEKIPAPAVALVAHGDKPRDIRQLEPQYLVSDNS